MKQILTFSTLLFGITLFSQNNYFFGYQDGFKYSCKCIDLPPKNVALYNGTYDQGYLDGKIDGILFNKSKSNNSTNTQSNNQAQNNGQNSYKVQPIYTPNYELLYQALNAKQNAYNSNVERINNYVNSLKSTIQLIRDNKSNFAVNNNIAALYLLENALYKDINQIYSANIDYSNSSNANYVISILDKHSLALSQLISNIKSENELSISRLSQVVNLYNSFTNKNVTVKDGWHLVYSTNQKDFCDIRRVYVHKNRIKKYVREGSIYKEWDSLDIEINTEISNCKSTLKLKSSESFSDIYFINVLADSNLVTNPPLTTGSVSFWTNYNKEQIHIYVENQFVGTLNSSFPTTEPLCAQIGTVSYINQAGTYKFIAISDKYRWEGTITVSAGGCVKQKIIIRE